MMTVQDIMMRSPKFCYTDTNLAALTSLLWSAGCGALPVVGASGKVVGIITDRDICIALGTRNRRASDLTAAQVMSRSVAVCRSTDEIHAAMKVMRARKVRRLPVLNDQGTLEGILCASDLLLRARHNDGARPVLSYEDIMRTLICIHLHPPLGASTASS